MNGMNKSELIVKYGVSQRSLSKIINRYKRAHPDVEFPVNVIKKYVKNI